MTNTTPKVSVCLPVFNGARYLEAAIESVLSQTHENWELLIADDVSTDESSAIIGKYAKQEPRIVSWRNERNKGVCANYNDCITRAGGALIKFVAQDDILEPNAIERMVAVLSENPTVSLVSCAKR
jgi:glycosyltransferase involved in cell wall biosynthesis